MDAPRHSSHGLRALALGVVATVAVTAGVGSGVWALANNASESRAEAGSAQRLADDDGDRPLFTVPRLAPGKAVSRCINVQYTGSDATDVQLGGASGSGGLSPYIDLRIDSGQGGGFQDCSSFRGTPIFRGTLEEFQARAASADGGVPAWKANGGSSERTFRFTLQMRDVPEAAGASTGMSFTWLTGGTPDAPVGTASTQTTGPAFTIGESPLTEFTGSSTEDDPVVTTRPSPVSQSIGLGSTPQRTTSSPASVINRNVPRRGPGNAGKNPTTVIAPDRPRAESRPDDRSFAEQVAEVAKDIAVRAAFPLLPLILAGLFLLVQHRLDRRDPKLALAPIQGEPLVPFGPVPPRSEATS